MRFVLALAAILLATPISAQTQCMSEEVAAAFFWRHGEHLLFQGETENGLLLELHASPDRGTWTVVVWDDELICVRAFGSKWAPGIKSKPEEET